MYSRFITQSFGPIMHALKPRIPETHFEGLKRESTLACVHKASISWEGAQNAANEEDAGVFL